MTVCHFNHHVMEHMGGKQPIVESALIASIAMRGHVPSLDSCQGPHPSIYCLQRRSCWGTVTGADVWIGLLGFNHEII